MKTTKTSKRKIISPTEEKTTVESFEDFYVSFSDLETHHLTQDGVIRKMREMLTMCRNQDILSAQELFMEANVVRESVVQWRKKYPLAEMIWSSILATIGNRRFRGSVTKSLSDYTLSRSNHLYHEDEAEHVYWHRSLKQAELSSGISNLKVEITAAPSFEDIKPLEIPEYGDNTRSIGEAE